MSYIQDFSCATCHGLGSESLWESLMNGVIQPSKQEGNFQLLSPNREPNTSYRENFKKILSHLVRDWSFDQEKKLGLIFGSTKALVEDFVWEENFQEDCDPFSPILDDLEDGLGVVFSQRAIISNACTSSHGALELAQRWLKREICDEVLVVAGDLIGPFTLEGFKTLRALSPSGIARPFDINRDGLILGDGMGAVRLSREKHDSLFKLQSVYSLCEGVSATRPDTSGKNLATCYKKVLSKTPELVITHGTGTQYNDQTEAQALCQTMKKEKFPKITGSKWSVGHSLGASGLIDLCLALECLKRQSTPGINSLERCDLEIAPFLLNKTQEMTIESVLISSLGFGGMCSALELVRETGR